MNHKISNLAKRVLCLVLLFLKNVRVVIWIFQKQKIILEKTETFLEVNAKTA
jgi:hypothetical protein